MFARLLDTWGLFPREKDSVFASVQVDVTSTKHHQIRLHDHLIFARLPLRKPTVFFCLVSNPSTNSNEVGENLSKIWRALGYLAIANISLRNRFSSCQVDDTSAKYHKIQRPPHDHVISARLPSLPANLEIKSPSNAGPHWNECNVDLEKTRVDLEKT